MNKKAPQKLKEWRISKGLTIKQASLITGIHEPTISNIENGKQEASREVMRKYIKHSKGAITGNDFF